MCPPEQQTGLLSRHHIPVFKKTTHNVVASAFFRGAVTQCCSVMGCPLDYVAVELEDGTRESDMRHNIHRTLTEEHRQGQKAPPTVWEGAGSHLSCLKLLGSMKKTMLHQLD